MANLTSFLKGKKTYILVSVGILTLLAAKLGYVTQNVEATLLVLEGFGTAGAVRMAISSLEDQILGTPQPEPTQTPPQA